MEWPTSVILRNQHDATAVRLLKTIRRRNDEVDDRTWTKPGPWLRRDTRDCKRVTCVRGVDPARSEAAPGAGARKAGGEC
jgi:hypothetical protein